MPMFLPGFALSSLTAVGEVALEQVEFCQSTAVSVVEATYFGVVVHDRDERIGAGPGGARTPPTPRRFRRPRSRLSLAPIASPTAAPISSLK
jgi:hypothetical protein